MSRTGGSSGPLEAWPGLAWPGLAGIRSGGGGAAARRSAAGLGARLGARQRAPCPAQDLQHGGLGQSPRPRRRPASGGGPCDESTRTGPTRTGHHRRPHTGIRSGTLRPVSRGQTGAPCRRRPTSRGGPSDDAPVAPRPRCGRPARGETEPRPLCPPPPRARCPWATESHKRRHCPGYHPPTTTSPPGPWHSLPPCAARRRFKPAGRVRVRVPDGSESSSEAWALA